MDIQKYNYYDILEISPFCAQHEVSTAYERAKATYSGDNPAIYTIFSTDEAREMLRLIDEAYSILGNKMLRSLYDEKLGNGRNNIKEISFETLQAESKMVFKEAPKKSQSLKIDYDQDPLLEDEIKKILDWNGSNLKKVREYKNINLEKLSAITKVSPFYLNALEEMSVENLPAAVFVRGYVGQVAKVLGLDEKKVCETYMKMFKENIGKQKRH